MATLTINTTAAQDTRIIAAVGKLLNLVDGSGVPRVATGAEVKAFIVSYMIQVVQEYEKYNARQTAEATVTVIAPT